MTGAAARGLAGWGLAAALFAALPWLADDYLVGVGLTLLMWVALTQSWCVLSRMSGYVSLGHAVFYGIGAYVVVVSWQALPLPLALAAAGLAAGAFAACIGVPVLRVRGPYFVILTFGVAELVKYAITAFESSIGTASRVLFGTPELVDIYWAMLGLAAAACALLAWVSASRFGHGLRSLRENEEAAETVGVPVVGLKLAAFVLSAIIPGVVGGLMALRGSYFVASQVFDPMISVTVIAMAVIGGGDDARSPLLGVVFLALLSEFLWAQAPLAYMIVLGAVLVVFVLYLPDGLAGALARRRAARAAATAAAPGALAASLPVRRRTQPGP